MKSKRRRNERTRLMLTLELAVVLPAAALVVLSALHLKSIQRDRAVEAAIQRDFLQVLKISEKQINHKAYDLADDVRNEFPVPGQACAVSLDRLLAEHPYAAHLFVYDPDNGMVFRSQPSRLKEPDFKAEADDLSGMNHDWMKIEYKELVEKITEMEKKGMPYYFFSNWVPRGEKHEYQSVALFLKKDASSGRVSLAGMAFDVEYLRDKFLPEMMDEVMAHNMSENQGEKNPAVIMVH